MELTRLPLAVKKPEEHRDGTDMSMLQWENPTLKQIPSSSKQLKEMSFFQLTGAGYHGDGALLPLAAAFGLNELGAAEEGVSLLALRAVGLVGGGKRRLQHRDTFTCKTRAG